MNITETVSYDKEGSVEQFPWLRRLFLSLLIILVALLSFGIGRLSVIGNREPITIEYDLSLSTAKPAQTASVISAIIASKNGSKYHYEHCSGAKTIKEENKVKFASPEAAEAAGYTLAANCEAR